MASTRRFAPLDVATAFVSGSLAVTFFTLAALVGAPSSPTTALPALTQTSLATLG